MVKGHGKGAWTSQPSRLRNELLVESVQGQNDSSKHVVQVPHSDTIVPGTQLDEDGRFAEHGFPVNNQQDDRENSLSPDDQAVIDRLGLKKKTTEPKPSAFAVNYLPMRITEPINEPVSPDLDGFVYMQKNKTQHKRAPKSTETTNEAANLASLTLPTLPELGKQQFNDNTKLAASSFVPPYTPNIEQNVPDNATVHGMGELQSLSKKTATVGLEQNPIGLRHTQAEIAPGPAPPVQPSRRAVSGLKKLRTGKKTKGKKVSQSQQLQQPTVPWPPRSETATALVCKDSMVDAYSADPKELCKLKTQDGVTHGAVEKDAQTQDSVQGHQASAYNQKSEGRNMQDNKSTPYGTESYGISQDVPTRVSQKLPGSSARHVFPKTSTTTFTFIEQCNVAGVDQRSRPTVKDQSALAPDRQTFVDLLQGQHATSQVHDLHHVTQVAQSPDIVTAAPQPSQPQTVKETEQPRVSEAVLHGVSDRGGSGRVSKPRRKIRVVNAPSSQVAQQPSMSTALEDSLEKLKLAMLADSSLVQNELNQTTKRYEETIETLKDSIAVWEKKYEDRDKEFSKVVDGAKNNQKYLAGVQKDLENVQKSANDIKEQSKKVLEHVTAELEQEKKVLRQVFEETIDKLTVSLRKMKKAGDELYLELVVSKSEKEGLKERLREQKALHQAAEEKRNDLEKKLLSCAETAQTSRSQVEKGFQILTSKLESLHPSDEMTAADGMQKLDIKTCLDVLRDLKATDSLTAEEVKGMLSSVNERLESGLDSILKSVEFKTSSDTGLRKFVQDQVQHLRADMTKYEEMAVENRKTHQSNIALNAQLEAHQLHSSQLEEQIQTFQQSEADLRTRSDRLERNLDDLRKAHNSKSDVSELEQGSVHLRGQLRKVEEDLEAACIEMERYKRLRQCLEQDGAKYKKCYENTKAHLKKMVAEHRSKIQNAAEMRTSLVKDYEDKISEYKCCSEAEIDSLKYDYSKKVAECKELCDKLDTSADQLSQMKKRLAALNFSLEDVRKQQLVGKTKLEDANQQSLSKSTEVAHLRERLQQTAEKLNTKTQDLVNLEQHCADTTKKATDVQTLNDRLQAQYSQQKSTLEIVRREADGKIAKLRQDAQSALQSSQSQLIALQKENHDLTSKLEKNCNNEDKLKAEQKAYIDEEHRLHQEISDLHTARYADLSQFRSDAAIENKQITEQHKREISDLNRRLSQAKAALEKSESDARLSKDQHTAKIASDQKVAASKFLDLETRYQRKIKILEERLDAKRTMGQDQVTQIVTMESPVSEPNKGVHASRNRKRVSRLNESVLGMPAQLESQSGNPFSVVQVEDSQSPDDDSGHFESLFEDQTGIDFFDDEPDLSLVGQPEFVSETQNAGIMSLLKRPEPVPETQDVGILSMSQLVFKERLARASQEEQRPRDSSSVEFSSIASEDLIQMQRETQPMCQPMLRGRERSYPEHGLSQKHVSGMSAHSDSDSVAEPQSSQSYDRPRSQANTASRMMPPPEHNSHRSQPRNGSSVLEKVSPQHSIHGQASRGFSSSNVETPDFVHSKSSAARQTYSQHDSQNVAGTGSKQDKVGQVVQDRVMKRKGSPLNSEREFGVKKPRNSSPADRSLDTAGTRPHASKPSVVGSRSKVENGSPYTHGPSSSSRPKASIPPSSIQSRTSQMASSKDIHSSRQRPSPQSYNASGSQSSLPRQTRSKSRKNVGSGDGYIDRFDEELGRRR